MLVTAAVLVEAEVAPMLAPKQASPP